MRREREFHKSMAGGVAVIIGALVFLSGVSEYLLVGDFEEAFFLMALGFGIAWFAGQFSDLYNLRVVVVRLIKKGREKRRQKRQKESGEKIIR